MKKNLFEMGSDFRDEWSSDNKIKAQKKVKTEILDKSQHKLHFAKEKRRGKVITIVQPFYMDKKELQAILKSLKKSMGTGGTIKDNQMEFQGDIKDKLKDNLKELGFKFK